MPASSLPRTLVLVVALTVAAASSGCVVRPRPVVVHPRPAVVHELGAPVVIARGHVHGARCGHVHHDGHWYLLRGHVHGKHCGHLLRRGVWVVR